MDRLTGPMRATDEQVLAMAMVCRWWSKHRKIRVFPNGLMYKTQSIRMGKRLVYDKWDMERVEDGYIQTYWWDKRVNKWKQQMGGKWRMI